MKVSPLFAITVEYRDQSLEDLWFFFENVGNLRDSNVCFVIMFDGTTSFQDHLSQILNKYSNMRICLPEEGTELEKNTVYLISSDKKLKLSKQRIFELNEFSIDSSIQLIAETMRSQAIVVFLSKLGQEEIERISKVCEFTGHVIVLKEQALLHREQLEKKIIQKRVNAVAKINDISGYILSDILKNQKYTEKDLLTEINNLILKNKNLQVKNDELNLALIERNKKMDELSKLSSEMDELLSGQKAGMIFVDNELKILRFTQHSFNIFSLASTDIGKSIVSLKLSFRNYSLFENDLKSVILTGNQREREVLLGDGNIYLLRFSSYKTRTMGRGAVIFIINISENKKQNSQINILAHLVNSSGDSIVSLTKNGVISSWNQSSTELYEKESHEVIGRHYKEIFLDELFLMQIEHLLKEPLEDKNDLGTFISQRKFSDGKVKVISSHFSAIRSTYGELSGISIIGRDITVENELRKEKDNLLTLVEKSPDFIGVANLSGEVVYSNPKFIEFTGLNVTDEGTPQVEDFHDAESFKTIKNEVLPALLKKGYWEGQTKLRNKYGEFVTVFQSCFMLKSNSDVHLVGTVLRDVSEQIDILNKIRKHKKQVHYFQGLFEHVPEIVFVVTKKLEIPYFSKAAEKLISIQRKATGNKLSIELIKLVKEVFQTGKVYSPSSSTKSLVFYTDKSEEKSIHLLPKIIPYGSSDQDQELIVILQDITHFTKLDELKTDLISTVSHELKNPLTSIKMGLEFIEDSSDTTATNVLTKVAKTAKSEVNRLESTIHSLLDLSRYEYEIGKLDFQSISVKEIMQSAVNSVFNQSETRSVTINQNIKGLDEIVFYANRDRLKIILRNLLSNAVKHTKEGSKVDLEAKISEDIKSVVFTVSDEGKGIHEIYLDKVFDKFFKIPGNNEPGSGFGLSIVKSLVLSHGGEINASNGKKVGAVFTVSFPLRND